MTELKDFKLTRDDVHSALWAKIMRHLEERVALHRKKNDGNLTPEQTAKLRGRIAETIYFLSLGNAESEVPEIVEGNGE